MPDPFTPEEARHEQVANAAYDWLRVAAGEYLLEHTTGPGTTSMDSHSALLGMLQCLGECVRGVTKATSYRAAANFAAAAVRDAAMGYPDA
jgi:hypothetical protein